jgi:cytochrome oxidase Cu insertion factor (SCO1/SenC/PrrC family)
MLRKTAVLLLWVLALAGAQAGNWARAQAQGEKKDAQPAPPEPKYKVGDMAPDFTMIDQNRQKVQLSSFRGKKNVALAFVVFAFTGG